MSTSTDRSPARTDADGARFSRPGNEHELWGERTRAVLTPIAAPSILGLFAATFGGLAQFLAGMWSYRARDGLATAMHGMWGAFWLAYGILFSLVATGAVTLPAGNKFVELGYWFIPLAAITLMGFFAALAESLGLATVLGTLATGAAFLAIFYLSGDSGWETAGGWVLQVSAWAAFYVASAMMLEHAYGRTILPLGKYSKAANLPGGRVTRPQEYKQGMPGLREGQ